jgi:CheY-like chemotaxis protein
MEFATSAPEALERAKTIADPLLIPIPSEINMPGMSGLEMLPKVKAARPNVPVIMITAYGDEATKKKAAELGANGLLTKPIDFRVPFWGSVNPSPLGDGMRSIRCDANG